MKQELKFRCYGRFMDDFFLFHLETDFLLTTLLKIQDFLQHKLWLTLNPKKIYLQDTSKWFLFLWTYIKPYRNYIWTRTKTNFYTKIQTISRGETQEELINLRQSINSYLWFLRYTDSYCLRKKIGIQIQDLEWRISFTKDFSFCSIR